MGERMPKRSVVVRFDPATVEAIDEAKGDRSREQYIRDAVASSLVRVEIYDAVAVGGQRAGKVMQQAAAVEAEIARGTPSSQIKRSGPIPKRGKS